MAGDTTTRFGWGDGSGDARNATWLRPPSCSPSAASSQRCCTCATCATWHDSVVQTLAHALRQAGDFAQYFAAVRDHWAITPGWATDATVSVAR